MIRPAPIFSTDAATGCLLQGLRPGAPQGRCPTGFGWNPLSRRHAPPSPPKKRERFNNPCTCRPSLASDASGVLAHANTAKSILRTKKEPEMNTENRTSELATNALATLAKALESGDSQALTNYLTVMARFHTYSWSNSLLIALQRPSATQVAGFSTWLKLDRHVCKGEKGIAILAPVLCKPKPSNDEAACQNQDSQPSYKRLVGFRTAYVFDVAQTDGEEISQFASVKGNPEENTDLLKTFISARGIALDYNIAISPARGVSRGGRITLLPGLAPAEEFSTLVHEIAHEMLHRDDRRSQTTKTIRETEAEAVAFVVCHAIQLDTNTAAADYIKLYNGDTATLSASLQFIQSTATEILTALRASDFPRAKQVEA